MAASLSRFVLQLAMSQSDLKGRAGSLGEIAKKKSDLLTLVRSPIISQPERLERTRDNKNKQYLQFEIEINKKNWTKEKLTGSVSKGEKPEKG